jgi:AcrR family transcriptional regulator
VASRLPAPERRNQLLDVALAVFSARGFHRTAMNDIADAAGITKPVLYQHFGSKRALYLELLADMGGRLATDIAKATAGAGSPREQVERGFEVYFRFVAEERQSFQLLFGGGTRRDPEFNDQVLQTTGAIAALIADLIVIEGLRTEERLLLAHGIVGLAEGTGRHWIDAGLDVEPAVVARQVADLAWRGLRGVNA